MQIPLLNAIVFAFLYCVARFGDFFILRYRRTEEQAISDFLSLPPPDRMRVPMFHLHIYLRRSVKNKGRAFVTGIDVTSRFAVFSVPTKTNVKAATLIPQIIKEMCQSVIRINQDFPGTGRPCVISTPDYMLYKELVQKISGHGTELVNLPESELLIIIPLFVITDDIATSIERKGCNTRNGQSITPQSRVAETYRPSKKSARMFGSTSKIENDNDVPPSIEFCGFCGKLKLRKDLKICKCHGPVYCSKKCQRKDWEEGVVGAWPPHGEFCKMMQTWPPNRNFSKLLGDAKFWQHKKM